LEHIGTLGDETSSDIQTDLETRRLSETGRSLGSNFRGHVAAFAQVSAIPSAHEERRHRGNSIKFLKNPENLSLLIVIVFMFSLLLGLQMSLAKIMYILSPCFVEFCGEICRHVEFLFLQLGRQEPFQHAPSESSVSTRRWTQIQPIVSQHLIN